MTDPILRRRAIVGIAVLFACSFSLSASAQHFGQDKVQYYTRKVEVLKPEHVDTASVVSVSALVTRAAATTGVFQDRPLTSASLAGTWTLDPYLSDHPEQIALALRLYTGEASVDLPRGAEGGGIDRGGLERGRSGDLGRQGTARGPSREPLSANDQKLLTELTDAIRFAPTTLTIAQTETTVTISTGAGAPDILRTDGKAEKHRLAAGTVDRIAKWEGPQLAIACDIGHAGTLTYTYGLAPTTGQLVIRVNFERRGEPGPFEIKLVYNPLTSSGISR